MLQPFPYSETISSEILSARWVFEAEDKRRQPLLQLRLRLRHSRRSPIGPMTHDAGFLLLLLRRCHNSDATFVAFSLPLSLSHTHTQTLTNTLTHCLSSTSTSSYTQTLFHLYTDAHTHTKYSHSLSNSHTHTLSSAFLYHFPPTDSHFFYLSPLKTHSLSLHAHAPSHQCIETLTHPLTLHLSPSTYYPTHINKHTHTHLRAW